MKRLFAALAILGLLALSLAPVFVSDVVEASTSIFYSQGNDGTLSNHGENASYAYVWASPHDSTTDDNLTVEYSTTTLKLGQDNTTGVSWIWRPVLVFDTSSLDPRTIISAATISIWGTTDETDVDDNITVVEAGDVHNPLVAADFDVLWYQTENLSTGFDTSGFTTGAYNTLTLNTTGISKIQTNGYSVFGLRTEREIAGNDPDGDEWVKFASSESAHPPKLTLTYTITDLGEPDDFGIVDTEGAVMVFSDVLVDDDQLYVFRVKTHYEADVGSEVPEEWFCVKIKDVSVRGQVPVTRWGYTPLGIYFDNETALPWGEAYDIELTGTSFFTTAPSDIYTLTTADWKGKDTQVLESWAEQTVIWLYTQDGVSKATYVTSLSDHWKLTEEAAGIFLEGIPYLDGMIPDIFITPRVIPDTPDSTTGAWSDALFTRWGNPISDYLDDAAEGIGINGAWLSILFTLAITLGGLVVIRMTTNDNYVSLGGASAIVFFFGFPMGTPLVFGIVVVVLAWLYAFVYKMFFRGALG